MTIRQLAAILYQRFCAEKWFQAVGTTATGIIIYCQSRPPSQVIVEEESTIPITFRVVGHVSVRVAGGR